MKFISNHIASCIRCPIYHRLSSEGEEAGLRVGCWKGWGGGGGGESLADAQTDMYNNDWWDDTCRRAALHSRAGGSQRIRPDEMYVWPALTLIDDIITLIEYCALCCREQGQVARPCRETQLELYRNRRSASPGSDWLLSLEVDSSGIQCLNDAG